MKITPPLKVTRFAKLAPGTLFICLHSAGTWLAIVAEDPTRNGEKTGMLLGPDIPTEFVGLPLIDLSSNTVISFELEYELRLPISAAGWRNSPPAPSEHCLLVLQSDDGPHPYWRANCRTGLGQFKDCYVDSVSGQIVAGRMHEYTQPAGVGAYAIEWGLWTIEAEPREILRSPASNELAAR